MKTFITKLAGFLFSALLLLDGLSQAIASDVTQTVVGGGVTVKVTYINPKGGDGSRFQVTLDAHSVNLDSYDLKAISVLRDNTGNVFSPKTVETKGSGHHRQATVFFGKIAPGTKYVEMVIKDVAAVKERVFRWELD